MMNWTANAAINIAKTLVTINDPRFPKIRFIGPEDSNTIYVIAVTTIIAIRVTNPPKIETR